MTWAAPVIILDLDDTVINYTGMAEECWRVICDESAVDLAVDGGHLHAMITNGAAESQRGKIVRFDLARHFDYILVEGELGHGKPDERVYRHALAQLGVEASDAMMVGDDLERDVAGPQSVGMRGVWIDRAGSGLPPECNIRPDRIIGSLAELL